MRLFNKGKKDKRTWADIVCQQETSEEEIYAKEEDSSVGDLADDDVANASTNGTIGEQTDVGIRGKRVRKGAKKIDKMIENLEFDPTVYYGWGNDKVDVVMQKMTKAWGVVASVAWFLLGSLTFAPILFMSNKINKFIDDKKKSFLISLIIYWVVLVFLAILIIF